MSFFFWNSRQKFFCITLKNTKLFLDWNFLFSLLGRKISNFSSSSEDAFLYFCAYRNKSFFMNIWMWVSKNVISRIRKRFKFKLLSNLMLISHQHDDQTKAKRQRISHQLERFTQFPEVCSEHVRWVKWQRHQKRVNNNQVLFNITWVGLDSSLWKCRSCLLHFLQAALSEWAFL